MFGVPVLDEIWDFDSVPNPDNPDDPHDGYSCALESDHGYQHWYTPYNGIPSAFLGEDIDACKVRLAPLAQEMIDPVVEGVYRFTDTFPEPLPADMVARVQTLFAALPQPMKDVYARSGIYGPELWVLECAD